MDERTRAGLRELAASMEAQAKAIRLLADDGSHDAAECWIDQRNSPLGTRKHCAAVRRRINAGVPGASIIGRRHLLAESALEQEMRTVLPAMRPRDSHSIASELEHELRLEVE